MRSTAAAVLVSSLCGLLAGAGHSAHRAPDAKIEVPRDLRRLWDRGTRLFASGRYHEAATVFEQGLRELPARRHPHIRAQFLNNLASARMAGFQYRDAVRALLEARDLATHEREWATVATISSNLATAYSLMGELATARATAEEALALAQQRSALQSRLLLRVATLRARQGEFEAAVPMFLEAARMADLEGDTRTLAQAWRTLGYEYLRLGELHAAEAFLLEAFRLDRLFGWPELFFSYRNLALLRAAQGDLVTAERLLGSALELARVSAVGLPLWSLYYDRGCLRRQRGRLAEALADFRSAVDSARAWRVEVLPAEAFGISVDAGLQQLYGALAETAAELARSKRSDALAREAFEAAEENRAASLQTQLERGVTRAPSLPPEYGDLLRELHALQLAHQRNPGSAVSARLETVRRQILDWEIKAGLQQTIAGGFRWEPASGLLRRLQQALAPDEAYLAFYLGDAASYRWFVTRDRFRLDRLPPRSRIARELDSFLAAARNGSSGMLAAGLRVSGVLFGGLEAAADKRKWFLALDTQLFTLPLVALPLASDGARPVYFIERHAIQVVPGARVLTRPETLNWRGGFLGVADPVYNQADPRWTARSQSREGGTGWPWLPRLRAAPVRFELPRLPGSSKEVRSCAAIWEGSSARVLEGLEATPGNLSSALREKPDVLHLATHVLAPDGEPAQASIMLSLGPDGRSEGLLPAAIRGLGPAPALVVLSGCQSGRGPALPGAGLLGLSRAWLAAGARTVIASLWPTPDDSGQLFVRFYSHLQRMRHEGARAPALALRQAQLEMLACGDWRARPEYWAAYVVIGVL